MTVLSLWDFSVRSGEAPTHIAKFCQWLWLKGTQAAPSEKEDGIENATEEASRLCMSHFGSK
jgi:hypothetical protein